MPNKRLTMRRIHRLMTLRSAPAATTRAISLELGISHSTVREVSGSDRSRWDHLRPLPAELTDRETEQRLFVNGGVPPPAELTGPVEQRLFVNGGVRVGARHHVEPDWAAVARGLKRPGVVNLMILWEEYRAVRHSDGYAYSRYCQLFREFEHRLSPSLRQTHVAGDKAGRLLGQERRSQSSMRRPAWCARRRSSSACWARPISPMRRQPTQGLPDWIGAHVRMFRFWGCEAPSAGARHPRAACTGPRSL